MLERTSAATAGNVPMVTVKMKHTENAGTEIWKRERGGRVYTTSCRGRARNRESRSPAPPRVRQRRHESRQGTREGEKRAREQALGSTYVSEDGQDRVTFAIRLGVGGGDSGLFAWSWFLSCG